VAIRSGRIVGIGAVDEAAARVVDAEGMIVAPGFVDIHTHYDAQLLWDAAARPSSLHGVTTLIGGNCGFTLAPMVPSEIEYLTRMLARVEGMPLESLEAGVSYDWRTFGEYLDRLEGTLAINAGFLVGHSTIRRVVMGTDAVGNEATADQIDAMAKLLGESLAAGGLGFSSTQSATHNDADGNPVPSRFATRDELIALSAVVSKYPGTTLEFLATVPPFSDERVSIMTEMSLAAQRPLNWNALAPLAAHADAAWELLRASDYASERGGRVVALTVPAPIKSYLTFRSGFGYDAIPGWAPTIGLPLPARMQALADPLERKRLAQAAEACENPVLKHMVAWEGTTIVETFAPANAGLAGRLVSDVARERGQDCFDVLIDVALLDELRTVLLPPMLGDERASWELRRDIWRDPRAVIGASDAGAHLDMLSTFDYCVSVLCSAREHQLMELEEAVRLLTDVPARLYGIRERGRVAEGWCADIVVFDAKRVAPGVVGWRNDLPAGAGRLYAEPVGIEHVIVNGSETVRSNELTGAAAGTLLRSGRDTDTVELG
jgi:N-acyl-D-aspartate/D-glutamate deacylase